MTSGEAPPRYSPAATSHASPSRHTRTSFVRPCCSIAVCHCPIVLSGTVTTCVMPSSSSVWAISSPVNMGGEYGWSIRLRPRPLHDKIFDEELHHALLIDPGVSHVWPDLQV